MRVPEDIRKCVVFIGNRKATRDGKLNISFIGTAFLILVPSSKKAINFTSSSDEATGFLYLVTAKHVAEKLSERYLVRINSNDGTSKLIESMGIKWFNHPSDPFVDVVVTPFSLSQDGFDYKVIPTERFLTDSIIQKKQIGIGDEVVISGLFAKVTGSQRNIPIVRVGNIAMMPGERISTKYGKIDAYLIEARSIGGISGSPVFVRETKFGGFGGFYLLGSVWSHWDIPILKENEFLKYEDLVDKLNIGITPVVPAKKILEVLNHPELQEKRRQLDDTRASV
jgi:hypothetical protein